MKAIIAAGTRAALVERPTPVAKPGEVVVRVLLAGLCRTDIYCAQGLLPVAAGTILGHEFCGVIEAVGEGVSLAIGTRVGVMPIDRQDGNFIALGKERDGAFADAIAVAAHLVYPLPDSLSDKQGAYLEPVAASLAVLNAPITPAMRGAIYGDNRIAELTGRILAAHGFNAVEILSESSTSTADIYDFMIETIPTAEGFAQMVAQLRPGGILVLKSRPYHAVALPLTAIVQKQLRLFGTHYGDFNAAIALLAEQRLCVDALLGDIYPFDDAVAILAGERAVPEDKKIFFKP